MRVGIAGYGVVGKTRHLSIEKNTTFQVTAVSEKNNDARKSIPSNISIYDDYKSLIADSDIDIIFISLPNQFAAQCNKAKFRKRTPCFLRKTSS